MRYPGKLTSLLGAFVFLMATACSRAAASSFSSTPQVSLDPTAAEPAFTPVPTRVSSPMPTPGAITASATPVVDSSFSPTPCPPDLCFYSSTFLLARPIAPPGRDTVDVTYRFGSTQGGKREPHHGVEFLNSAGTPVLAAADGLVVVAGDDRKVFYGPYANFYGNLVVLKHDLSPLPGFSQVVYTLYGHLSQVLVEAGQKVKSGQEIGKVGMTGVATGSHLHFEVRVGEDNYKSSRNPELWLAPHLDEDGQLKGALAGRILDEGGNYLAVPNIVLEHLSAPDQPADLEVYLSTYAEEALTGQPPWNENFGVGDLPAGQYRIRFVKYGMQERIVQVLPGQLTVVTFKLGN